MVKKDKKLKNCTIFFDFDNTITEFDVLDDMLERFSKDDEWLRLEEAWKSGKIGSRQCLEGQMKSIRISPDRLDKYLATIRLDPSFNKLLKLCDQKKMKKIILSDNFEFILKSILKNNGVSEQDIYCNSLKMLNDTLAPEFPHTNTKCGKCAHCKTKNVLANIDPGSISIYIGDGLSDVCPSKKADLVFAKNALKNRLKKDGVPCISFDNLGDVYEYLKRRVP